MVGSDSISLPLGSCQSMKRQDSVALNQNYQLSSLCTVLRDNPGLRSKESVSFSSKKKMLSRPSSLSPIPRS